MTRARGADFSSWQDDVHVRDAARELDFAFVKATEGVDYVNPRCRGQVAMLETQCAVVGLYHFLAAGVDGAAQWDHFERHLFAGGRVCPIAVDYEAPGVTDAIARAFIRRAHQRGFKVGLYASSAIAQRRLGQNWTWAAWWAKTPPPFRWDVWQFAAGEHGGPDWNLYNGDAEALVAWARTVSARGTGKPAAKRWWIHDHAAHVALGPYRLPALPAALVRYLARRPRTDRLALERK